MFFDPTVCRAGSDSTHERNADGCTANRASKAVFFFLLFFKFIVYIQPFGLWQKQGCIVAMQNGWSTIGEHSVVGKVRKAKQAIASLSELMPQQLDPLNGRRRCLTTWWLKMTHRRLKHGEGKVHYATIKVTQLCRWWWVSFRVGSEEQGFDGISSYRKPMNLVSWQDWRQQRENIDGNGRF